MASTQPAKTVNDCMNEIALWARFTPRCREPGCNAGGWIQLSFVPLYLTRPCTLQDDLTWTQCECHKCRRRGILANFLPSNDILEIEGFVELWLQAQLSQAPVGVLALMRPGSFYNGPTGEPLTPVTPGCEADKPIGTRDPDKFLKEQQNKLWSGGP